MILMSESVGGLQDMLDKMSDYTNKWGMSVNTYKTKILIYRKGVNVHEHQKLMYNGSYLENVDQFLLFGCFI